MIEIDYFKMMQLLTALQKSISNLRTYCEIITQDVTELTQQEKEYLIRACDVMHLACDLGYETQQLFLLKDNSIQ